MEEKINYQRQITPDEIKRAGDYIRSRIDFPIQAALVLGSGQSNVIPDIENSVEISYGEIPEFPISKVAGHKGVFQFGFSGSTSVAIMRGRVHAYEGWHFSQTAFGIRILAALGAGALILTNAAGAVNESFSPGDLCVIHDHINLMGGNPLTGPHFDEFGKRFVDMTCAYDKTLLNYFRISASKEKIKLQEGIYAALAGPSYETPAEIRMLRTLGADLAGMSTVPEVIVANQAGLRTAAVSLVTNMGAGIQSAALSHEEVTEVAAQKIPDLNRLLRGVLARIDSE